MNEELEEQIAEQIWLAMETSKSGETKLPHNHISWWEQRKKYGTTLDTQICRRYAKYIIAFMEHAK